MSKRGRPAFKPTPRLRRDVTQMRAVGESKATIARAIGIDEDTLNKHFAEELLTGLAKHKREVTDLMFKAARKGNVTAQKALDAKIGAAGALDDFVGDRKPQPEAKQPKLGKKEQAIADAHNPDPSSTLGDLIAKRQALN